DLDDRKVLSIIESALAGAEAGTPVRLERDDTRALLNAYGIEALPYLAASSVEEGLAAAERIGYAVALTAASPLPRHRRGLGGAAGIGYPGSLKAVSKLLRHRMELGGVRLNIDSPDELAEDFAAIQDTIRQLVGEEEPLVDVQAMAPHGVPCVLRAGEDPLLGPLLAFSLAGDTTELLGDVAHRVAPITDKEAGGMIRS